MKRSSLEIAAANAVAILRHTPNGVLLVDQECHIRFANAAFRTMFSCGDEDFMGKPAAQYVHSDCFERAVAAGGSLMVKETIREHDLSFRVGLFPIEGEHLYCGIFINTTEEEQAKERLHELRVHTLQRAQEVISRQMQTAQEIARLLGETTAETKVLLYKVMSLFEEEGRP